MGHILYTLCIFPIAELIELCYTLLYRVTDSYGVAVVGLSFAITLLTLPIYMVAEKWQEVEREKEKAMAPKVGRIRKAFKGDERFLVLSAYYREEGYKPIYALRSTFSILIQIPFFLAAYAFLSHLEPLKGYSFWFLKDLGRPDGLLFGANLLPVVMTAANCISGAIYSKGHGVREKVQIYGMAAVFLVVLYDSPSGLLLYWTMNNVLSLVKNVFSKLKHPGKALHLVASLAMTGISLWVLFHVRGVPRTKLAIYALTVLIWLLPLWRIMAAWVEAHCFSRLMQEQKLRNRLFLLAIGGGICFLA